MNYSTLIAAVLLFLSWPLFSRAQMVTLDAMDTATQWSGQGVELTVSTDCVEGAASLLLSGSGQAKFDPGLLRTIPVETYDRLVMNVKIPSGHVTDFGVVTRGFPQPGAITFPRWAQYDESTPAQIWLDYSCDLHLCEWWGGEEAYLDKHTPALSLVFTPGKGNSGILVDNVRLIKDPIKIAYDWRYPMRPIRIATSGKKTRYEKELEIENVSDKPVEIAVNFSGESLKKFGGKIAPASSVIAPKEKKLFTAVIEAPAGLQPLEYELQTLEIVPNGDRQLIQRMALLTAAPFPKVKHPFTVTNVAAPFGLDALLDKMPVDKLPEAPCIWLSQSALNTNGGCDDGHAGQSPIGFDALKCNTCGKVQKATPLTGGVFHRLLLGYAVDLGAAYQTTRDPRYAQRARRLFLTYCDAYKKYKVSEPLNEASSALAPNNATYILGTVVMTPMTRALDLIWDSGALSEDDKKNIAENLLWPAALEMMKINPGMTNMQDAMTEALFNIGLLLNDPNLTAAALFGSHGLRAKIESVFDEDGATPESVSPGYHGAALGPVLAQVQSIRNSGLKVDFDFQRLEKAKKLMDYLRMPDGRVPSRGDTGFPGGAADAELATYGSMSFPKFGMTVLREGHGPDALYVSIDHRPPAVTHSHYDKLGVILYGKGEWLGVDEGSTYNTDTSKQVGLANWSKRSAWGGHSLVHNTLTVDETDQQYGGGKLLYFHGREGDYQAVAASTDNVYKDVLLERNIVMLDGLVVMVDRCLSETDHRYDWTHHSFGALTGPEALRPRETLGKTPPYSLAEDVKMAGLKGPVEFTWKREKASLRLTLLPDISGAATDYATAMGWANEAYQKARQEAPFVMARRAGKRQLFITVFEPFKGDQPEIAAIQTTPVTAGKKTLTTDEAVGIKVTKAKHTVYFLFSFVPGNKKCGPIESSERCHAIIAPL